jgi:hypothetical protein
MPKMWQIFPECKILWKKWKNMWRFMQTCISWRLCRSDIKQISKIRKIWH